MRANKVSWLLAKSHVTILFIIHWGFLPCNGS
jgi:hypothetical protein